MGVENAIREPNSRSLRISVTICHQAEDWTFRDHFRPILGFYPEAGSHHQSLDGCVAERYPVLASVEDITTAEQAEISHPLAGRWRASVFAADGFYLDATHSAVVSRRKRDLILFVR